MSDKCLFLCEVIRKSKYKHVKKVPWHFYCRFIFLKHTVASFLLSLRIITKRKMISKLKPNSSEIYTSWKMRQNLFCIDCVFCIAYSRNVFIALFNIEQMLREISILFFSGVNSTVVFSEKVTIQATKVHYICNF